MVKTTRAQREALHRKWVQNNQDMDYCAFRRTVQPTFGMDGAVVVQWCGMWLAIESDGYTHS